MFMTFFTILGVIQRFYPVSLFFERTRGKELLGSSRSGLSEKIPVNNFTSSHGEQKIPGPFNRGRIAS